MSHPFDDADGMFHVLVNSEGQHSLWPALAAIPDGWESVHGEADREACLRYVEESWTDMRPRSLVEATDGAAR
ncbi:MbtH family protein [Streptomyces sp. NPDC046203]|uniref:MbtH family protein n=1 Tax=Streptomyces sp. NPDC046203 TaxID=3154602 RepID=UPI0033C6AC01